MLIFRLTLYSSKNHYKLNDPLIQNILPPEFKSILEIEKLMLLKFPGVSFDDWGPDFWTTDEITIGNGSIEEVLSGKIKCRPMLFEIGVLDNEFCYDFYEKCWYYDGYAKILNLKKSLLGTIEDEYKSFKQLGLDHEYEDVYAYLDELKKQINLKLK